MKKMILFILLFIASCGKADCNKLAKLYAEDSCTIIVEEMPVKESSNHNFYIIGRSILTSKDTIYDEENRWFCLYYKNINKNDTIIKKRGELIFSIHKKDTILKFNWECQGKVYE